MSNQAPIGADMPYVSLVDGTALTTTTATNIEPATATNPAPTLPFGFFQQPYGDGKVFEWEAAGVVSTAASTPGTLTMALAIGPTPTVLVATPAFTPAVSLANGLWVMKGKTIVRSVGTGAQWQSYGTLKMANGASTTTDMIEYQMPANTVNTSWEVAYDTTQVTAGAYTFHVRATWGTAPAGDSILCAAFTLAAWN